VVAGGKGREQTMSRRVDPPFGRPRSVPSATSPARMVTPAAMISSATPAGMCDGNEQTRLPALVASAKHSPTWALDTALVDACRANGMDRGALAQMPAILPLAPQDGGEFEFSMAKPTCVSALILSGRKAGTYRLARRYSSTPMA